MTSFAPQQVRSFFILSNCAKALKMIFLRSMLRKIQKKIIRAIPYSIKKDLFRYHLYTDNAILYHNPIPYCDTKIFAKWMSLTRQISVLFNMVGRKIARMELDYVAKKFSKNEAISRNAAFNN
ncbi:hypothetical protein D4R99_04745, partial [bacterium]